MSASGAANNTATGAGDVGVGVIVEVGVTVAVWLGVAVRVGVAVWITLPQADNKILRQVKKAAQVMCRILICKARHSHDVVAHYFTTRWLKFIKAGCERIKIPWCIISS
jgi:hypothetical protein